jgi:hypothetical protein
MTVRRMLELKVPSLQHLARNWRDDPVRVKNVLIRLATNPPRFNYNSLIAAVTDLFVLHVPYDQVVAGIKRGVKLEAVRENLLGVLPLIRDHFAGVSADFYQSIDIRYYPVARGLIVPFEGPMIYGVGGQLYFPWFSFWRRNPLANERLSLFITVVEEVLLQDPDLENAKFEVLDFSAPNGKRELNVIDAADIPRIDEARKVQMLATFAQGFFDAQAELKGMPETSAEATKEKRDPDQPGFFDDIP